MMHDDTGDAELRFADGSLFEGRFEKNCFSGFGIMHYASQNVYEGIWVDDQKHDDTGSAIFQYVNGDRYQGNFVNNFMEDKEATFKFNSGNRYKGWV